MRFREGLIMGLGTRCLFSFSIDHCSDRSRLHRRVYTLRIEWVDKPIKIEKQQYKKQQAYEEPWDAWGRGGVAIRDLVWNCVAGA